MKRFCLAIAFAMFSLPGFCVESVQCERRFANDSPDKTASFMDTGLARLDEETRRNVKQLEGATPKTMADASAALWRALPEYVRSEFGAAASVSSKRVAWATKWQASDVTKARIFADSFWLEIQLRGFGACFPKNIERDTRKLIVVAFSESVLNLVADRWSLRTNDHADLREHLSSFGVDDVASGMKVVLLVAAARAASVQLTDESLAWNYLPLPSREM